ncbi:DUF1573 domain-containing protein [Flavobacterium silvaticum]|uniref:DUF1573 domain-containing protein n=1 Tax=Flavobacterium silvaticum TaxID=1852020 RepID=A0A972JGL6_9FLAO|nr:DUF1573 domain-containing protein [Flavobacterium silvaticum]NMH27000.1 DUF1573 domain-containing protein [Flavobacterium silvaticum]
MKSLFLTLGFLAVSLSGMAQKGAKIEFFAKDNTVDYGKVAKGSDDGLRTFEFTNTGDAPLIISNVESTCGCTVPSKPTEPIMPGKMGKIDVKYNMNPGKINKTIYVDSNAVNVDKGRVALHIIGEVINKQEVNLLEKKKVGPMK